MLDHQQRVAQVAEFFQRIQQTMVVAGMQADRRLVEHVEYAAQPAAQLRRQPDALHLAAGKRRGGSGKRQIFKTDVDQELHSVDDLAGDLAGDLPFGVVQLPTLQLSQQSAQRQAAELVDRSVLEPHRRGVVAEPAAAADRTLNVVDQVFQLRPHGRRAAAPLGQGGIEALVLETEHKTATVGRARHECRG